MSFRNTKTPTRADISGKAIHQCPMHKVRGIDAFYLDEDTEKHFRRLFTTTMNRDMMRIFGISFSTLQRFKRQLGLEKKMQTIRHKQAQLAKKICEENGYYDSIRGIGPSEQCKKAAREKRATGWHPMDEVKKNKARYKRLMQKRSENRKETIRRERIREYNGLTRMTNLHIPYRSFSKRAISFRNTCQKVGYIPGSAYDEQERWVIYYTDDTKRGAIRERNGDKLGFKFKYKKIWEDRLE